MRSMDVDNEGACAFGEHSELSISSHRKEGGVCCEGEKNDSVSDMALSKYSNGAFMDHVFEHEDSFSSVTDSLHSPTHKHLNDHGYSSLHDMIEIDIKSHHTHSHIHTHHSHQPGSGTINIAGSRSSAMHILNSMDIMRDNSEEVTCADTITSTTTGYDMDTDETNSNNNNTCDGYVSHSPPTTVAPGILSDSGCVSSSANTGSLPPINSNSIDLDSSVSNLSWLQNIQQQIPEGKGTNLAVNPQTGTPSAYIKRVSEGQRNIRVVNVTMPSNVHLSNTGNIKYVTVQGSKQPVRISASRPLLSHTTPYSSATSGYHRIYSQNSGALPSSTVPDNPYPKPAYSYSCLIALSLKNSRYGRLPVAEIYNFMMTNFPYFKTAPDGWKNSVRHNLSLNKCFEKIENPNSDGTHSRKGCLWAMNAAKVKKMDEEIAKWNKKDLIAIRRSMANPDLLDILTKGQGSFLTEKSRRNSPGQAGSQFPHRPGIRIVTAVQQSPLGQKPYYLSSSVGGSGSATQANVVVERQDQLVDQIDFNRLVEDAADLFGDHDDLALDPSLSELALQNGMFEEMQNDIFELPPICNQNTTLWTPTTSTSTASSRVSTTGSQKSASSSHMYNTSNTVLPIIF